MPAYGKHQSERIVELEKNVADLRHQLAESRAESRELATTYVRLNHCTDTKGCTISECVTARRILACTGDEPTEAYRGYINQNDIPTPEQIRNAMLEEAKKLCEPWDTFDCVQDCIAAIEAAKR